MPGMVDHIRLGAPVTAARTICVFAHGRNQSPEAMEANVIRHLTAPGVAPILPWAGSACWFHARAIDPLTQSTRAALALSLADLGALGSSQALGRHPWRPALLHYILEAAGHDRLVTHIFDPDDPCIDSDAVFGAKESLLARFVWTDTPHILAQEGLDRPFWLVDHDFVLSPSGR